MTNSVVRLPHHQKVGPCLTRPAYRDGRRKTAVKVYTVTDESCYVLFFGVPSIGLEQALKDKCRQFGQVTDITRLSEYPDQERFTDVFLVKFSSLDAARGAKRTLDDTSFYGGSLHLCYAPEYETVADCRMKLYNRRRDNTRKSRKAEFEYAQRLRGDQPRDENPDSSAVTSKYQLQEFNSNEHQVAGSSCIIPVESKTPPILHPLQIARTILPLPNYEVTVSSMTYGSDALDDARRYWSSQGADFVPELSVTSQKAANQVEASCSQNSNSHTDRSSTGSKKSTRSIPLPVLQALTCRPYSEIVSTQPHSATEFHSHPVEPSYISSKLLPRVLLKKSSDSKVYGYSGRDPIPPKATNTDAAPIQVRDLKQLALKLGPLQGPQLPGSSHSRTISPNKRVVFYRELKRRKLDSDEKTLP